MGTRCKNADVKLSIVIPCCNVAETIGEQLEALSNQEWEYSWEVVVVNNCCTDHTIDIVESYYDDIKNIIIVSAFEKKNLSYARNKGVRAANGEYIAFCDGDDVVGKHWLSAIGDALFEHGFVACKIDWSHLNNLTDKMLKNKVQTEGLIDFGPVNFLQHGAGGTLGIKKNLHYKVGGFNEAFKYLQDMDYSWRVQLAGHKLTFVPEAVIHYRARNSHYEMFKQEINWGEYDIYMYEEYKHYDLADYTLRHVLRSLYNHLRSIKCFFSQEKRERWIIRLGTRLGRLKGMIKYNYLNMKLRS